MHSMSLDPVIPIEVVQVNVSTIARNGLCTGCGTCASICPNDSISIVRSSETGVYVPEVDGVSCEECGACVRVCPGPGFGLADLSRQIFSGNAYDRRTGSYSKCYLGFSTDAALRRRASSGGLVTELLLFALEEGLIDGALVTRMRQDNPLESETFIARNQEEILQASGSKYCPVSTNVALKDVLSMNGRYAVVGLPCHIVGIRKFERLNDTLRARIVLRIGLFCKMSISYFGTSFLLQKYGVPERDVTEIRYRGEGWPGKGRVWTKSGAVKEVELMRYYDARFRSFVPHRCRLCDDYASELADISFGDAWLPESANDSSGTSVVVTRTQFADGLLEKLRRANRAELSQVGVDKIIESQGGMRHKKVDIKARMDLSRLAGHRLPVCDDVPIARPRLGKYMDECISLLPRMMANNPDMWHMLDEYWRLMEIIRNTRVKVTSHIRDARRGIAGRE